MKLSSKPRKHSTLEAILLILVLRLALGVRRRKANVPPRR